MLHVLSSITSRQSTSNISHWDREASPDSVHHWHSPADQPLKGLIRISENVLIIFRPRTSHPHNSIILLEVQLTKLTIIGNANTLWLTHHITYNPSILLITLCMALYEQRLIWTLPTSMEILLSADLTSIYYALAGNSLCWNVNPTLYCKIFCLKFLHPIL